ncbi:MAG: accessory factor UbiK family protein [Gammaproteobacteria bacterium]|nr:accessory factor UbiK family protein [Gammaproteobacteria bacterium]
MDKNLINDLAQKLAASVPAGVAATQADLEQNFSALLQSGLDRLDLVTREEFDVQRKVLARTREKLAALEEQLASLEAGHATAADNSDDRS